MCKHCNTIHNLSEEYLKGLPPLFKRTMQDLHSGKLKPEQLSAEMVEAIAQELLKGVGVGFELDPEEQTETFRHRDLRINIEDNVYVFSGFKTYQQLKEASMLLRDESGILKPFSKFLKDVLVINDTYNVNYLQAEYNNAVASGQMAENWQRFENTMDVAPYLKYKTAEDERVRESHRPLNDVVKRVDDAFWNMYYPPNGWGCRCDVIQVIDAEITEEFDAPLIPGMFRNNVGKTGIIFPETHPYFTSVDQSTQAVIRTQSELIKENVKKLNK